MRSLWYTGYVAASLTFLALVYVEWQVPGFVSSVFPIYIVLLIALVCGVGALVTSSGARVLHRRAHIIALTVGIAGALLVFQAADAFGAFRLVLAIIVLVLPSLLLKALSDVKE
jgi:hypothetical protein